jgi:hypothetical protein
MNGKLIVALMSLSLAGALALGLPGLVAGIAVFYFAMPFRYRVNSLVMFALLPLGPGIAVAGLRLTLFELLSPLLFVESLFSPAMRRSGPGWTRTTRMVAWGVGILILALAISYARNPAGTAQLFGGVGGQGYGIRAYYQALACILAFMVIMKAAFCGLVDGKGLVTLVAWSCLVVGLVRVANYVGAIPVVPFFEGNLRYMSFEGGGFSAALAVTKRVGGLDQAGGYGLLAAYTAWVVTQRKRMLIVAIVCALLVIYGGGRSAFVGVSLAILLDMASGGMRRIARALPVVLTAYLILTVLRVEGQTVANPQFERLAQIMTGTRQLEEDSYRLEGFQALFAQWKENPFLGSGIGAPMRGQIATISEFGGHGAFISVIGLFGILGLAYLALFVFAPLLRGVRQLVQKRSLSTESAAITMRFASLLMVLEAISMLAGGNGYADFHLAASVALLAGAEPFIRAFSAERARTALPGGRLTAAGAPAWPGRAL